MAVYPELETLYKLIGKASVRAREDEDWLYVRDRLNDLVAVLEEVVKTGKVIGADEYRTVVESCVKELDSNDPSKIIRTVMECEEGLAVLIPVTRVARFYAIAPRIITGLAGVIVGLVVLFSSDNVLAALSAALASGLAVASLILALRPASLYTLLSSLALLVPVTICCSTARAIVLVTSYAVAVAASIISSRSAARIALARVA